MNYEEKMNRIIKHLEDHPHDYQSKISLMKLNSRRIDTERRHAMIERLRNLSEIRRRDEQP